MTGWQGIEEFGTASHIKGTSCASYQPSPLVPSYTVIMKLSRQAIISRLQMGWSLDMH